ncbi:MAG: hypothetical protein ACR2K6_08025 [Solirubrobacterales bacterium]
MDEQELREAIRRLRVPDEEKARRRSLELVRQAAAERQPPRRRLPRLARHATAALLALLAAIGLAFSPAGAKVAELIDADGVGKPADTLDRIPGGGRILAETFRGAWIVNSDGSKRRLGDYDEVSFSAPLAANVAAADNRSLSAVGVDGEVRWSIVAPDRVRDPRWSPNGFRVAYRGGTELRLVNGDGTGDRALDRRATGAPAWRPLDPERPAEPQALAYPAPDRRVVAIEPATGRELWETGAGRPAREIDWPTRDRVVITRAREIEVRSGGDGRERAALTPLGDAFIVDSDAAPDGRRIAYVTSTGKNSQLWLARVNDRGQTRQRRVLTAPGAVGFSSVSFSPDGSRLLLAWQGLDQWLFINPDPSRKQLGGLISFGDLSEQFTSGGRSAEQVGSVGVSGWAPELPED